MLIMGDAHYSQSAAQQDYPCFHDLANEDRSLFPPIDAKLPLQKIVATIHAPPSVTNLSELSLFQRSPGSFFLVTTRSSLSGTLSASNSAGTL